MPIIILEVYWPKIRIAKNGRFIESRLIMKNSDKKPKKLSFISIYFLGINAVIGSGTFLLPAKIYHEMNLMAIVVLLLTAVVVSMIALCYADLSSRFKGSGAAWLYAYHAFGRFTGYELGVFT